MKQKKEFVKSKQAGWDRVKIRSTKYLFCCKIVGLLENSYHKCALATEKIARKIWTSLEMGEQGSIYMQ